MKLTEEFMDLPYLGYREKQVKNEPLKIISSQLKKFLSYLVTRIMFYYVIKELSMV